VVAVLVAAEALQAKAKPIQGGLARCGRLQKKDTAAAAALATRVGSKQLEHILFEKPRRK